MSNLFGFLNLNGVPAGPELLETMARAFLHPSPDNFQVHTDGPFAIGVSGGSLATAPTQNGTLVAGADGRVDNYEELVGRFPEGEGGTTPSEWELALRVYEKRGADCFYDVFGDFGLVLWDGAKRELYLARDIFGVRSLFYAETEHKVVFANEIRPILAAVPHLGEPDASSVAAWLSGEFDPLLDHTFYEGVLRVRPSTYVHVKDGSLSEHQYWGTEPFPTRFADSDETLIEEFGHVFGLALKSRCRSEAPIGCFVSGGLDSSSVLCAADHQRQGQASPPPFVPISFDYAETIGADERPFKEAVLKHCKLEGLTVNGDEEGPLKYYGTDKDMVFEEPIRGNYEPFVAALDQLKDMGVEDILTGHAGDHTMVEVFYHRPQYYWDIPFKYWRNEARYSRRKGLSKSKIIKRWLVNPDGPLAKILGGEWATPATAFDTLASPRLLTERRSRLSPLHVPRFRLRSHRLLYDALVDPNTSGYFLLTWERMGRDAGMTFQHPFLDRRVVEHQLSIPARLFNRDGMTKYILREAMTGILPEKVRTRRGKSLFNNVYVKFFVETQRGKLDDLLRDSEMVRRGYVESETIKDLMGDLSLDMELSTIHVLNTLCQLEIWLRRQ